MNAKEILKIIDNVDLKELEKFGFNIKKEIDSESGIHTLANLETENSFVELYSNGIIYITTTSDIDGSDLYWLYDLIQAGLVEKVVGNE